MSRRDTDCRPGDGPGARTETRTGTGGRLRDDERAVTSALGQALAVAITAVLISGVLMSTSAFVTDQRERAGGDELAVLGQRTATQLVQADRLVTRTNVSNLSLGLPLPERVVGSTYTVTLTNDPGRCGSVAPPCVALSLDDPSVERVVAVEVESPVLDSTVTGRDARLVYDGTAFRLGGAG